MMSCGVVVGVWLRWLVLWSTVQSSHDIIREVISDADITGILNRASL